MRFWRESYIVFRRQLRMNLRNPAWIIIGMLQPVLYLFLFGPLLEPLIAQFGFDNAYTFFVPGMLVQLGIFGAFFAGFSLIGESSRPNGSPLPAEPRCWSGVSCATSCSSSCRP